MSFVTAAVEVVVAAEVVAAAEVVVGGQAMGLIVLCNVKLVIVVKIMRVEQLLQMGHVLIIVTSREFAEQQQHIKYQALIVRSARLLSPQPEQMQILIGLDRVLMME
jgi:hypothetical protein